MIWLGILGLVLCVTPFIIEKWGKNWKQDVRTFLYCMLIWIAMFMSTMVCSYHPDAITRIVNDYRSDKLTRTETSVTFAGDTVITVTYSY